MKSEKKKLIFAVTCLAGIISLNQFLSWVFPNLYISSPYLIIGSFVALFLPMAISVSYLTGTLIKFVARKIVYYEKRQKALNLPLKQRIGRILLVWLVLACSLGFLVGSFNLPTYWVLSKRGLSASGRELKTAKGINVGYEFKVGKMIYKSPISQQPNEKLYHGAKVTVVYDPLNPQTSIIGPVKPFLYDELVTIGMIILFFPSIIVASFMFTNWKRVLSNS